MDSNTGMPSNYFGVVKEHVATVFFVLLVFSELWHLVFPNVNKKKSQVHLKQSNVQITVSPEDALFQTKC